MNRHSRFCDRCGHALPPGSEWPKKCYGCPVTVYPNPIPIGVALVPLYTQDSTIPEGLLIGKRNHEPKFGEWGLPGGFQNDTERGETTLQAAVRELYEETGLRLSPHYFRHHMEYANAPQCQTLAFYLYIGPHIIIGREIKLGATDWSDECSALDVWSEHEDLCFDSHTQAAKLWLSIHG